MFSRAVRRPLAVASRPPPRAGRRPVTARWRARTSARSGRTASRSSSPVGRRPATRVQPVASTTASGSPTATSAPDVHGQGHDEPGTGARHHVLHLHRLEHDDRCPLGHRLAHRHRDQHHRALERGGDRSRVLDRGTRGPSRRSTPAQAVGIGKMLGSPAMAGHRRPALRSSSAAWASAAARAVRSTAVSPGVQKAWTPGVESAKSTPAGHLAADGVRLVPGARGVVAPGPRPGRRRLDGHHADVVLGGVGEQGLGIPAVGRVRPQLRVDREHHRVEVVAPQCLEVGGRRASARGR